MAVDHRQEIVLDGVEDDDQLTAKEVSAEDDTQKSPNRWLHVDARHAPQQRKYEQGNESEEENNPAL